MCSPTAPGWFDPAPYDSADLHELTSSGTRVSYRTGGDGSGPRILFVHGGRAHAAWWSHQIALFGASAPRWAAMDLSGHGDSGWRDEYRAHLWLAEVRDVAAELADDGPLVLVGHSLGGMLSVLLAASGAVPGIEQVVTVDAIPLDPGTAAGPAGQPAAPPHFADLALGIAAFTDKPARHDWPDWLAHFVGHRSLRPHEQGWVWRHDSSSRIVERPTIDDFGVLDLTRLTLISGERSPFRESMMASRFIRRAGDDIRHLTLDAGHDVMMERPVEFHAMLRGILGL